MKCTKMSKRTGEHCKANAVNGTVPPICFHHGGAAPQVRRKAAERVAEAQAAQYVRTLQITPIDNPLTALAKVAGEIAAIKDRLGARVDALTDEQLRSTDDKGAEQVRSELTVYVNLLNQLAGTLGVFAKLNIDERLARIDEETRRMILRAMEAGLSAEGIAGPQARNVLTKTGQALRVIGGGKAA